MKLTAFTIKNFKSFENVTIHLNPDLNIFTGVNNSGKTTVLEAIALWSECFRKLLYQARRAAASYRAGDYVFGPLTNRYYDFDEINSVRCPYFEDLFRDRKKQNKIVLSGTFKNDFGDTLTISFRIGDSVGKYNIELENHTIFDYGLFNRFFKNLPNAIGTYYTSPVAYIKQKEDFVTDPQVSDYINLRESSSVIRNRLYRLYQTSLFGQFQQDLSYILYNNPLARITFYNNSDIQKDTRVIINYKLGVKDYEKDLALLGSGTLQAIEILLNIYQYNSDRKDLNLILLDEPDSHIHRDIQKRLLEVILKFTTNNQIFITTHNESLIRSSSLKNLFHLESAHRGDLYNMYSKDLSKVQIPHFSGMYPDALHPLIKSIGNDTGLDFINAIEADKIIFVEGDDDARVIFRLLQEYPPNQSRRFMFWVLGGVSKVFDKINAYKTFFSDIKNAKSLWEKSFLVIDKDCMTDAHMQLVSTKIDEKLNLNNHAFSSYTQESILFSDLDKLSRLLEVYLKSKKNIETVSKSEILQSLTAEYEKINQTLSERYSENRVEQEAFYKSYKGSYVEKTKIMFNSKNSLIEDNDVKLIRQLKDYYNEVITQKKYFKLMNKGDVEMVLNEALKVHNISINIENDFYEIISCVDKSIWFTEWDFLSRI